MSKFDNTKNFYNITHWKIAVELLQASNKTTLEDIMEKAFVTKVIARRLKRDYQALKRAKAFK